MADHLFIEALEEGGTAYQLGFSQDDNPYDYENDSDLYDAWELGFEDAQEQGT